MNRRGFLQTLGAALVGATLDPERLLWVPGQKTIFLPPVQPIVTTIDTRQMFGVDFQWSDIKVALALEDERAPAFYASRDIARLWAQEWDARAGDSAYLEYRP